MKVLIIVYDNLKCFIFGCEELNFVGSVVLMINGNNFSFFVYC